MKFLFNAIVCILHSIVSSESSSILFVSTFPAKSHFAVVDPLLLKLAERGHHVTAYTPFPKKTSIPNYTEYDVGRCSVAKFPGQVAGEKQWSMAKGMHKTLVSLFVYQIEAENIANCEPLYELLNSTKKYDLFLSTAFVNDALFLYANKFRTPIVAYVPTADLLPWHADSVQNPRNPSYMPELVFGVLPPMSFLERVENTLLYCGMLLAYRWITLRHSEETNKRLLGSSARSIYDTVRNTSVLFVNSHHSLNAAKPLVPATIEIGGIHIKPLVPLPKDIEKFINESKHGVVYFCMGSLLRGETFPEEKRNAFLYAFSKIPQRVLWKWEGDVLPGKPDNVMIAKWMPQRDILAHPNIKLFISHGGLLGTSEAVYEGVPILGIPIFGDQRSNIKAIEANGAGELLDYNEISNEIVLEKIQRLTTDPKYKENAKQLSERYKDRPMSPLDTAVYWTEYVIRHKGAPHLKTAAVNMPLYQYLLLDVIAFLIFVFVSAILILYYSVKIIVKIVCNLLCGKKSSSKPTKKEKRS